ncbi:MAG: M24 family metallopeptidase [Anaerolineales bacterium]
MEIVLRQKKLKESSQAFGLDAVVINPGANLYYLTGLNFHLSERPIIFIMPVNGHPVIVLPELESAKIENASFLIRGYSYGENPETWVDILKSALERAKLENATIGIEPNTLRVLELNLIEQAAPTAYLTSAIKLFEELRIVKEEPEIEEMRKAVKIAQNALTATLPKIKIGITEREIAAELTMQLLKHGSLPNLPFFPIVSSGPNSANPHASPSDRKLVEGDLLVIDYGANVNGYLSDITRTFAIGDVEPEYKRIAETVLASNHAGHAAARLGNSLGDVDRAARQVIERAGYGEFFIHRTGHGLGLESHEAPYIRSDNDGLIQKGMSFTIEPGIYLPGRGGVRIEDDVIITESGCESLTDLPRELINIKQD